MKYVLILSMLVLAGCASAGNRFDMSHVAELKPGISTEADAIKLLGHPTSTVTSSQNDHQLLTWSYSYAEPFAAGTKQVAISFDAGGKMIKVLGQTSID